MIGDVMAVVAALVGICISAWALMMTCGLLFPARAESAREFLMQKPKAAIVRGALLAVVAGFVSLMLLSSPVPGTKMLGLLMLLSILGCGALGGAGLSFVASDRIKRMAPELSDYGAFARGAGYLVVASVFPILGWFFFGPLALFAAVGCGAHALVRSAQPTVQRC